MYKFRFLSNNCVVRNSKLHYFFTIPNYILLTIFCCLFVFLRSLKRLFYGEESNFQVFFFLFGKEKNWKYDIFLEMKASLFIILNLPVEFIWREEAVLTTEKSVFFL